MAIRRNAADAADESNRCGSNPVPEWRAERGARESKASALGDRWQLQAGIDLGEKLLAEKRLGQRAIGAERADDFEEVDRAALQAAGHGRDPAVLVAAAPATKKLAPRLASRGKLAAWVGVRTAGTSSISGAIKRENRPNPKQFRRAFA